MKRSDEPRNVRTAVRFHATSSYEASHRGALNILEKGRPSPSWSGVSPAVLGEIDQYVHALAGR